MKRALILLITLPLFSLLSCDKEDDNDPLKTPEEYLTQHAWAMEELTQVENNALIYYKRGGSTNTANYDNDYLSFNTNGTGNYSPTTGQNRAITWQFTNAEKTKLTIVITFSPTVILTLKCTELELSDTRFFCVNQYTNASGQPVLASVYRKAL